MSPLDDFVSTNVEITSRVPLGVTVRKEKVLTVMYLLLIFFMLGWFLYSLIILLMDLVYLTNQISQAIRTIPGLCYGLKMNIKLMRNFYLFS